jgi:hypothetical protein
MRKIFVVSVLALVLLSGCAEVHSGVIKDKVRQGSQWDMDLDICRFQLDTGTEKGWLEVSCPVYESYEVGDKYPR